MIIVQSRNRRTGTRRTFQVAEITPDAKANVVQQLDMKKDILVAANKSKTILDTIGMYTGHTVKEITQELTEKERILKYMVKNKIADVDHVGWIMAKFYTDYDGLMKYVKADKVPKEEFEV